MTRDCDKISVKQKNYKLRAWYEIIYATEEIEIW